MKHQKQKRTTQLALLGGGSLKTEAQLFVDVASSKIGCVALAILPKFLLSQQKQFQAVPKMITQIL